jgi:hypothetical protein
LRRKNGTNSGAEKYFLWPEEVSKQFLTYFIKHTTLMQYSFLQFRFLALILLIPALLSAQKVPSKYGNVNAKDFEVKLCSFDSSAHAMYLFDFGESGLEFTGKGWQLVTYRHSRIIVFDADGVNEANREFFLYTPGGSNSEDYEKLSAASYNIENGEVVKTKMEKSAVFKERSNEDNTKIKFTVPNGGPVRSFRWSTR